MSKPLISIITATYNDKLQLLKTSESIKESTYRNIEWVVIDGLSTDGTFEWLKSNTDVVRKWVSEPDCGIYDAWNKGLAKAEGEWIIFLGAGDLLRHDWLQKIKFDQMQNVDIVYGDLALLDIEGERFVGSRCGMEWESTKKKLMCSMCLPHPGMLHRSAIFIGNMFSTKYKIVGDWEFFLRAVIRGGYYVAGATQASVLLGGVSSGSHSILRHQLERQRLIEEYQLKMCPFQEFKWVLKVVVAKWRWLYAFMQRIRWSA